MPDYAIQTDVKSAFSIQELEIFRLDGGQPYAIVAHDPAARLISDIWFGSFKTEERFRAVLEFICDRFDHGGYRYWLADLRYMTHSFAGSEDWLADYVFPRTIAAGLRREAVVLPENLNLPPNFDVFGAASAALRKITDGRVRGFTDISSAKAWLLEGSDADR